MCTMDLVWQHMSLALVLLWTAGKCVLLLSILHMAVAAPCVHCTA